MAVAASVQELIQSVPYPEENVEVGASSSRLPWISASDNMLPAWWNRARDTKLRDLWKKSDHLAAAVYGMKAKMTAIPFKIVPRNTSIRLHFKQAEMFTQRLRNNSGYLQGWNQEYGKFIVDLHTQDNGGFMLIMGDGPEDGPIVGPAMGMLHLDAWRCTRTSNPLYPVVYEHIDGKRYKLHYSRVMSLSQMPAPEKEMYGVGVCAVSRAINSVQSLMDIARYKQEKMGSRPPRAFLVGNGMTQDQLLEAIAKSVINNTNMGLTVFDNIIALASLNGNISLELVDLASVPDGFDEETWTTLAMYLIAFAFGVDQREFWPASASGATKADATVQHQKARGKAPGDIMQMVTQQLNLKFLPDHLEFKFDFQDDEQDLMRATIKDKRSISRERDLKSRVIDERTAREEMLEADELNQGQFERLELADGRLPDGNSVLALFFSDDDTIKTYLKLGIDNPLAVNDHEPATVIKQIEQRERDINVVLANTTSVNAKKDAQHALAALKALRGFYQPQLLAPLQPPDKTAPHPPAAMPDEHMLSADAEPPRDAAEDTVDKAKKKRLAIIASVCAA